jgi:hypothetical protein
VAEASLTHADRILATVLSRPGLTDAQLRRVTGVEPHQQVNQICRLLEAKGLIRRVRGADGRITNIPATEGSRKEPMTEDPKPRPRLTEGRSLASPVHFSGATPVDVAPNHNTLVVIPCSGKKARGGDSHAVGRSIVDLLPARLAVRLREARASLARAARLDESHLLPAASRYSGTLYESVGSRLAQSVAAGVPFVIISGGYGLVLATEPIGTYNRRFAARDWPAGLLEECLASLVKSSGVERVIGFCARTTSYAELLHRVRWRALGLETMLAVPDIGARGGAQVLVPRASGEALRAFLDGQLLPTWTSADGVVVRVERVA